MKKLYLIILIHLIAFKAFSQVQTDIIRQKTLGGSQKDLFKSAVRTSDNGFLIGISSESDISGDRTVTRKGSGDIWLIKLHEDLSVQWQKSIGGTNSDFCASLISTNDGGYLLLAGSDSPISLDKTVENYGYLDYWLIKLNAFGELEWQKTYGGNSYNGPAKTKKINNYYLLAGISDSDSSGVKTENSRGDSDFWIVLIDSVGNIIADKTLGGSSALDFVYDIAFVESENEILIVGFSDSPVSGDITTIPYSLFFFDYIMFRVDFPTLDYIADYRYGGNNNDWGISILLKNNKIYFAGRSDSDSSGTKTEDSKGGSDYWIIKLNNDGSIIWDKTIGGINHSSLYSIYKTSDHQVILLGTSASDIGNDKTEMCYGGYDFWIVSIDTTANILWQKTIGGSNIDILKQVIVLGTNHYILFGDSKSGVSGLKTEYCRGEEDIWIVEISTNLSIENFSKNKLDVYPNPVKEAFVMRFPEKTSKGILYIFDTKGAIVYSTTVEINSPEINISQLNNGMYFISFFDETGKGYSAQIVKQ